MVRAIFSISILLIWAQPVVSGEIKESPIPSELEGVITLYVRDKAPPSRATTQASVAGGFITSIIGMANNSDELFTTGLVISFLGGYLGEAVVEAEHQAIRDTDAYKEAKKIFGDDEIARDFTLDLKSRYDLERLIKKYTPEKYQREVVAIITKERQEFDKILPKDFFPYAKTRSEVLDAIAGKRALYWLAAQNASRDKKQKIEKLLEDEKTAVVRYIANRNATPHATAEKYPSEETHSRR